MFRLWIVGLLVGRVCADPLDLALGKAGLSRDEFRFDSGYINIVGQNKYLLGYFKALFDHPIRVPTYLLATREELVKCVNNPAELIIKAIGFTGTFVRRGVYYREMYEKWEKESKGKKALKNALKELVRNAGKGLLTVVPNYRKLPRELRAPASVLFRALSSAIRWREEGLRRFSKKELIRLRESALSFCLESENRIPVLDAIDRIDDGSFYAGAVDLARGVDYFVANSSSPGEPFSFRFKTRLGSVVITNSGEDSYEGKFLLIVDFSGKDTYRLKAAPISAVIDFQGDDSYEGEDGSLGSAILGYSILIDTDGNDTYRSEKVAEGAGFFGVGFLGDFAGNDVYEAVQGSQGAGQFGVGVLLDRSGDDRYHSYTDSQGYGFTRGCGILIDIEGNDTYLADTTDIRYASAQNKKHNTSTSQGAGFGLRDDLWTGRSMAGGVGLLIDEAGNDSYTGDVFAQGAGYWYGVGALMDRKGNDVYRGYWYHCGTGAHCGIGAVIDDEGDDLYQSSGPSSLAFGHDFSLGIVLDLRGNDTYDSYGPATGNQNGFGVFVDAEGDDVYKRGTLGKARISWSGRGREFDPTVGIFLDLRGNDKYPRGVKNNSERVLGNIIKNFISPRAKGILLDLQTEEAIHWWH